MQSYDRSAKESAIELAKRGWALIPLHYPTGVNECSCRTPHCSSAAKHPITRNGLKNASSGTATILNWWRESPRANVGILTGQESGLVVLDVDPRHGGEESLNLLIAEFGSLPKTLTVKTGGKGWHYYFKHPGVKISNKAGLRSGLDIRGDGGYVVAPPSTHASLSSYEWVDSEQELAPLPEWLLKIICNQKVEKQASSNPLPVEASQGFPDGSRNASLLSVGGFLKSKGIQQEFISKALGSLNQSLCQPPLAVAEVEEIANRLTNYEEKPWGEVIELPTEPIAPELTADMLPTPLKSWCFDISERMQVPLEFVAGPAIVAIASMIGRKAVIYPKIKDNWQVVPNLWGCLIAPPGSMKSPALASVLKMIQNLSVKAREEFLETFKKMEAEKIVAKTEIEALKDALKAAIKQGKKELIEERKEQLAIAIKVCEEKYAVIERRYMMNDPTIEKLLSIIQENPQGLLLYRDELSGWMETMGKSGREGDREFFLESWNGDTPYSMDRIGRGSTFVDGLCLSVLGGLQPSKFQAYVASLVQGGKSDDGLLQRFQILLYPEKRKSWKKVDREPDAGAAAIVEKIFDKIAQLPLPERTEDGVKRVQMRFDSNAQALFDKWRENLELRLLSGSMSPILESHLSKYRSLMPSLALIFEAVEVLGVGSNFPQEVGSHATTLAIRWCEFLEMHAQKSYGEFLDPEVISARSLLAKIKSGAVKDYDRCREIYRHGWKGVATLEELDTALRALEKLGWLRTEVMSPPTGRRFEILRLHPSLRLG